MSVNSKIKAKIICKGLVQGVGFRYFVLTQAAKYNLSGYAKNLANGDVEIVVEGNNQDVEKLFNAVKQGPNKSKVENANIETLPSTDDFIGFDLL